MIALVDCNHFYASCERLFRPDLRNKPIVVLSNNDGCVISLCDRAKALGIEMGASFHLAKAQLEKMDIAVFSSNYALYGDISRRVMKTLSRYSPKIEVYSIDEIFIDLKGLKIDNYEAFGHELKNLISKNIGIPTCVGIASTKTLAKASNHIAKKFKERTAGVWILDTQDKIDKCLAWLPIEDIWGIGRKSARKLRTLGVYKALNFVHCQPAKVKSLLSIVGLKTQEELKGKICFEFQTDFVQNSICISRSFGKLITDFHVGESAIAASASRGAQKLRKLRLCSRSIQIHLSTNPLLLNEPQYNTVEKREFEVPTNDSLEIVKIALQILKEVWKNGFKYKKAGIVLFDNVFEEEVQENLFDKVDRFKALHSMKALDRVHQKYGSKSLELGMVFQSKIWEPKCEHRSPKYTTCWSQIPKLNIG